MQELNRCHRILGLRSHIGVHRHMHNRDAAAVLLEIGS